MDQNRKPGSKSINELYDNFDNCTEEDLERLKKKAFWFDKDKCTEEFLSTLRSDLLNKKDKPIIFTKKEIPIDRQLLLKQFQTFEHQKKINNEVLVHNFQSDLLFRWPGRDIIIDFFTPIHYHLFTITKKQQQRKEPLDLNTVQQLQNALVYSVTRETSFKTMEFIQALEELLDSTIMQVIMNSSIVLLIFEWKGGNEESELTTFSLCIGFTFYSSHNFSECISSNQSAPIVFDANDLFDNRYRGGEEEIEKEESLKKGIDLAKAQNLLREAKLSYNYYGFIKK